MIIFLSSFAPENLVSRDRFCRSVPRQPAHHGIPPVLFPRRRPFLYTAHGHRVSPELIRSRKCVPMTFTAESPAGTGSVVLKEVHHGPINARLSSPTPPTIGMKWACATQKVSPGIILLYIDPMLLPSGNPFKCHEEVLFLQPIIPPTKRFDIFPPLTEACSEGLHAFRFSLKKKRRAADSINFPLIGCGC